jgi:hypothetical protein
MYNSVREVKPLRMLNEKQMEAFCISSSINKTFNLINFTIVGDNTPITFVYNSRWDEVEDNEGIDESDKNYIEVSDKENINEDLTNSPTSDSAINIVIFSLFVFLIGLAWVSIAGWSSLIGAILLLSPIVLFLANIIYTFYNERKVAGVIKSLFFILVIWLMWTCTKPIDNKITAEETIDILLNTTTVSNTLKTTYSGCSQPETTRYITPIIKLDKIEIADTDAPITYID